MSINYFLLMKKISWEKTKKRRERQISNTGHSMTAWTDYICMVVKCENMVVFVHLSSHSKGFRPSPTGTMLRNSNVLILG